VADSFRGRSTLRSRAPTTRRRPGWSIGPGGTFQRTTSGQTIFPITAVVASDDVTVIRTRGELTLFLSDATSALDGFTGAIGICKVTQNAAGVGITAVPHPLADIAWDGWLWYHFFSVKAPAAAGFNNGQQMSSVRYEVDSKAMRKSNVTDNFIAVIDALEVGGSTLNGRLDTRMLSKIMV